MIEKYSNKSIDDKRLISIIFNLIYWSECWLFDALQLTNIEIYLYSTIYEMNSFDVEFDSYLSRFHVVRWISRDETLRESFSKTLVLRSLAHFVTRSLRVWAWPLNRWVRLIEDLAEAIEQALLDLRGTMRWLDVAYSYSGRGRNNNFWARTCIIISCRVKHQWLRTSANCTRWIKRETVNEYVKRRFQSYLDNNVGDVDLWKSIYYDFEYFIERIWKMISSDNWIFIKKICLIQEFWLNQVDQKNSRFETMYKVSKKNYYVDRTLNQIQRIEKAYERLFRDIQIRKNKLQSLSIQLSSIQLSSSSSFQSFRSSSSFSSIEIHQNDALSEIRTHYESDTRIRQNRYADVRNSQFYSDARYDDRNRQFNLESRFNFKSRFDSNRIRTRQYEISEYALENLYTVNEIRRAFSKRHIYAFEFYDQSNDRSNNYAKEISSLSKIYKDENRFNDSENNFDFKLLIFFDRCSQMNLSEHAYLKAASIMLSDQTLTYYYSNKVTYFTFDDFCINMRTHFENSEWQRSNLDK
jgi:hypothetical protein